MKGVGCIALVMCIMILTLLWSLGTGIDLAFAISFLKPLPRALQDALLAG